MQPAAALEVVQFELLLGLSDLVAQGFEAACQSTAERLEGGILFNRRLDGDPVFQRVAAVAVGAGDEVALVFLDHSGTSTFIEDAKLSRHMVASVALVARSTARSASRDDE